MWGEPKCTWKDGILFKRDTLSRTSIWIWMVKCLHACLECRKVQGSIPGSNWNFSFEMSIVSSLTYAFSYISVVGYLCGCCCVIAMYWCNSMEILLVLASLFVGSGSMSTNALMSVVVDLFPTSLRYASHFKFYVFWWVC